LHLIPPFLVEEDLPLETGDLPFTVLCGHGTGSCLVVPYTTRHRGRQATAGNRGISSPGDWASGLNKRVQKREAARETKMGSEAAANYRILCSLSINSCIVVGSM
jgi:hypothetical protein